MNISIFGLTISSSWGNGHATPYRAIVRALAAMGHRVTFFERDLPYYAAHRDLTACDFCDIVLYDSWADVRDVALRAASESEIVVTASYCPEGARVNDEILGLNGPIKVYYDLDAPVTLARLRSRAPVEYLNPEQLPEFDLVLSWTGGQALEELASQWGARMARPLFGCVDPDVYRREPSRREFECVLSYMGTYAPDRQEKLDALFLEPSRRKKDLRFLLAGSLYPWNWQWGENVTKLEHVAPSEHPALYSSSRCTLNITRADMASSGYCPSGRFFEAAACATPIISDWFDGLDYFFTPGEEIVVAQSADDVLQAIDSDEQTLRKMAGRARDRTLEEHSGACRARQFLSFCEQAKSGPEEKTGWQRVNSAADATEAA